ncbi:hypothetical protein LCGC14_1943310 [marine sediment metagenome]|uniref:Uncharacterized protein n=1 Tax=marine sediment metagenome TaxID=412755 RepID=A0A0F9FJX4_9ZZZZ
MEAWIPYIIPIFVAVFVGGWLLGCWMYIRLRMRWHEKGILDFNYDGHDPKQNPEQKTIFDYKREEKEYDRKMKEQK